jgi:hypothetical protein
MRETKYEERFAKQLRKGLRKDGKSIHEVCAVWNISRKTYYAWIAKYPAFSNAHDIGNRDCAIWWHQLTRAAATGSIKANAGIICFALKNIEDINWTDKSEVTQTASQEIRTININVLPTREEIKLLNSIEGMNEGITTIIDEESD